MGLTLLLYLLALVVGPKSAERVSYITERKNKKKKDLWLFWILFRKILVEYEILRGSAKDREEIWNFGFQYLLSVDYRSVTKKHELNFLNKIFIVFWILFFSLCYYCFLYVLSILNFWAIQVHIFLFCYVQRNLNF